VGWGGANYALSGDMGSGHSDAVQVALHGRVEGDKAYVSGGVGYGYNWVTTDRRVTIAGDDRFRGEFAAHNLAGEIEAGYQVLEWLTTYGAVRGQAFFAPGYSEQTVAGVSTFALDYAAQSMLTMRTELGLMADWTHETGDGSTVSMHAGGAWAHTFRTGDTMNASFQALGVGSTFAVSGATPSVDTLLLSASAAYEFENNMTLGASVESELAWNVQSYSGSLSLTHRW
jgi:uncharacterized protein with beta-barrel porin domain